MIPTTDLVFYALGSGEYDEMACEHGIAQHQLRTVNAVQTTQLGRLHTTAADRHYLCQCCCALL